MRQFTFDVKLFATLSVWAENEGSARAQLHQRLERVHVSFEPITASPIAQPIYAEACADGEPDLLEIDGEQV